MNNKEIVINIYVESFKEFCPLTRINHNYDFGLMKFKYFIKNIRL